MSMQGKVGVVTGGAEGLGKGFAEALLKRGVKVCIADVNVQTGEATASTFNRTYGVGRALFVKCDVSLETDVKGLFERVRGRYGRVDVEVNNAGISNEKMWSKMVDINLKGVLLGTQYGIDMMRKDKGGNGGLIINTASTAGLTPVFTTPAYAATKYGVVGYTRSLGESPQMREQGIRFACLCPSFTNTAILTKEMDQAEITDTRREASEKMMETVGIMEVGQVVAGFEVLLDMPDNNGVIMAVTYKSGPKIRHKSRSSKL